MAICTVRLKNGRKRYFARLTDPATGRKVCSKRFNRKKDAEQAETEMKAQIYRGESIERCAIPLFHDFCMELTEQCTASEKTVRDYERIQDRFSELFGCKTLRQITTQDCERAVASLSRDLAPVTVDKYVIRLRHIFERAVAYGFITVSPAKRISNKPKAVVRREIQTLTADEIKLFLAAVDDYHRPLFTLWFATGLRRAEIFGLEADCIDIAGSRIHVRQQLTDERRIVRYTKSRRPRTVPVAPEILGIVVNHMERVVHLEGQPRLVFPSVTGRPVHYSDFGRDVFKPAARTIGRPHMTTHDIRHTFASQALSQGINIKTLQVMLGHSDASLTLNRYSHLIPSDAAIAAEKMADLLVREDRVTRIGHSGFVYVPLNDAA